jgi:hypothetical protein
MTEQTSLIRYMESYNGTGKVELIARHFKVVRKTKCGYWIELTPAYLDVIKAKLKFVNTECDKQYAYKDEKKALAGFIYRKKAQIRILSSNLDYAERALVIALGMSSPAPETT